MGHARALLGMENSDLQIKTWKKVIKQGLSVRRVEQLVKEKSLTQSKKKLVSPLKKSPNIVFVEDKFREIYGTQVRIYPKKEGGKIEIEYYSDDDLDRIYNILITDSKN